MKQGETFDPNWGPNKHKTYSLNKHTIQTDGCNQVHGDLKERAKHNKMHGLIHLNIEEQTVQMYRQSTVCANMS